MALAGALRAAEHGRACVRMYDHARAFVAGAPEPDSIHGHRRAYPRVLRKSREANTKVTALLAQLRLPLAQLGITGERQRCVHGGCVVAGIKA